MRFKIPFVFLTFVLSFPALAFAPTPIQPGKSIANIPLGMSDTAGIQELTKKLGSKPTLTGKDTEYEGQIVYYFFFGTKNKENNSYPLQVYSDVKHHIFIFEVNTPEFKTPEGIHVGSSEAELLKAYGKQLKKIQRGSIYLKYTLGGRKGTDFYVRNKKITQILIRDY